MSSLGQDKPVLGQGLWLSSLSQLDLYSWPLDTCVVWGLLSQFSIEPCIQPRTGSSAFLSLGPSLLYECSGGHVQPSSPQAWVWFIHTPSFPNIAFGSEQHIAQPVFSRWFSFLGNPCWCKGREPQCWGQL